LKLIFTIITSFVGLFAGAQTLKVGVYQNPPLVIIDENNEFSGFCIDILKDIAQKEGWQLQFHKYDFAEGLRALAAGDIDLLPAIAYSVRRDSTFILNETSVITNWAKLYKHADDDFNYSSLEQLRFKRIAALKNDFYLQNGETGLLDLLQILDIPVYLTERSSYEEIIDNVENGQSDLGLVSRYYGILETAGKDVVKTPINVAYVSIRYGFSKNDSNLAFAGRLDNQLQNLINNRSSAYYNSERKYLSFEPQAFIPQWLWKVFVIVTVSLAILMVFIVLLQHQVKKKTSKLEEVNKMLRKSEREARLAAQTIEASQDIGFWFQPGKHFIRVNQAAIKLTGFSESELMEMVPRDLIANNRNQAYYDSLRDENWGGHLLIEETFRKKDGGVFPVELSLDQFELDGQIYICGFARDITDRVEAERKIIATILSTEDKERSRISKELHDSVGQTLSAISLHLDSLTKHRDLSTAEMDKIKNIENLLKEAIAESRSVSHNLMPPALTDLGFTFAVENLLNSLTGVGETKFSFHSNETEVKIAKEIEFTLFRITQEAINNIIKYAEATEATIQYLVFDDLISLSIEDNGKGFDMNIAKKNHNFGLNSMKNRAASVGGELTIDASPGKGTGIHVNIPLK
jgi:PAS domain S-box-containing protein